MIRCDGFVPVSGYLPVTMPIRVAVRRRQCRIAGRACPGSSMGEARPICVGVYGRCDELLRRPPRHPSGCRSVMDIGLPGMSGIEGVAAIKSVRCPATEVLMVTVYEDE